MLRLVTYIPQAEPVAASLLPKERAELIRAALKAAYPGVAFSIRTSLYSKGSTVIARWTGGPSKAEVEAVAAAFITGTMYGTSFEAVRSEPKGGQR